MPPGDAAKSSRMGSRISKILAVVAIIVFAMIYFGRKLIMGTKYKVNDKESINYSKKATETDAKKLGELLQTLKVFDGTKERDVLLSVDETEGTVISFVFSGNRDDEAILTAFRLIGEAALAAGFTKPLTIRLMDENLNTLKDIPL